jgi:cobalt-zinc-cadmium efflux system membrane fusion protein
MVEGREVVFVRTQTGFRATPVVTGSRSGGRIVIVSGLQNGQRIATENAFLLKAELGKEEAEHGH